MGCPFHVPAPLRLGDVADFLLRRDDDHAPLGKRSVLYWTTVGDAGIALTAYGVVAVALRPGHWLLEPTFGRIAAYLLIGLAITIVLVFLAVPIFERWAYAPIMPIVPVLWIDLLPVIPWLILPHRSLSWPGGRCDADEAGCLHP